MTSTSGASTRKGSSSSGSSNEAASASPKPTPQEIFLYKNGKYQTNKLASTFLSVTINSHFSDIEVELAERNNGDLSIFENQINESYL